MTQFFKAIGVHLHPESLRCSIQRTLLLASEDMSEVCVVCGLITNTASIKCCECNRWVHFEKCATPLVGTRNVEECMHETYIFKCIGCTVCILPPFEATKHDSFINLSLEELYLFVVMCKPMIEELYENRETHPHCYMYNHRHQDSLHLLKWDYSTEYFDQESLVTILLIIKELFPRIAVKFICYVLLGNVAKYIFLNYYGYERLNGSVIVEKYRELNRCDGFAVYPCSYTLNEVLEEYNRQSGGD